MSDATEEVSWEASKKEGNAQFGSNNFEAAVTHYTLALSSPKLTPGDRAVVLNNRALAFLKLAKNEQAIEDCTASLIQSNDVDSSVKAYFRRFVFVLWAAKDTPRPTHAHTFFTLPSQQRPSSYPHPPTHAHSTLYKQSLCLRGHGVDEGRYERF